MGGNNSKSENRTKTTKKERELNKKLRDNPNFKLSINDDQNDIQQIEEISIPQAPQQLLCYFMDRSNYESINEINKFPEFNQNETISNINNVINSIERYFTKNSMSDSKYKNINVDIFKVVLEKCHATYNHIFDDKLWFDGNIPNNSNHIFNKDPVYIERYNNISPLSDILIIGDLHSSLHSLNDILQSHKFLFQDDSLYLLRNKYIIFTGDIIDRGPFNLELLYIVMQLRIANPDNVIIINGNHEDPDYSIKTRLEGSLGEEIEEQFNGDLKNELTNFLYNLPSAIFIKFIDDNEWYQFCHGLIHVTLDKHHIIPFNPRLFLHSETSFCHISNDLTDGLKWGDIFISDIDNHNKYKISISEDGIFKIKSKKKDPLKNNNKQKRKNNIRKIFFHESSRPEIASELVELYLNYNNIRTIISGHQDLVNLLLFPKWKYTSNNLNDAELSFDNHYLIQDSTYMNLITDSKINKFFYTIKNKLINSSSIINQCHILNPSLYSTIITSTSTESKFVSHISFLLLTGIHRTCQNLSNSLPQFGGSISYPIKYTSMN